MKLLKVTTRFWAYLLICSFGLAQTVLAQMPLPADTAVRVGVLDNGLTYFIRKNTLPQNRADFYIAQRVGSMQEEDNQKGLAHFLEHIAFNGTKHFPGKAMINWLETLGARFGSNINAYTGFDETVYTLKDIPVERTGVVDSCLLILHDWSCAISLEDKEIDAERGVIQEEWRSGESGDRRVIERVLKDIFPGHRYGERIPIGSMEVVRNFKDKELRDYYKKWYRPDLQALIVVGDIDVEHVERTIKAQFRDVPKPENPAQREYLPVEDHDGIITSIQTDPEKIGTQVSILFKSEAMPRELMASEIGLQYEFLKSVFSMMLGERFAEITKKPSAPFIGASAGIMPYGYVARTKDAFSFMAMVADGRAEEGLKALMTEIERVRRYGFTDSEYKRASKNFMANLKKAYNERDKRKNNVFTTAYVDYFTKGGTLADITTQYGIYEVLVSQMPVDAVNGFVRNALATDSSITISVSGPEKSEFSYPNKDALAEIFRNARGQEIEAYKEEVSSETLIDKPLKSGRIVKEDKAGKFGSTIWTLSNGVQVIFLPTKHKEDQILLNATRPGGIYSFDGANAAELRIMGEVNALGGLGKFDETALAKVLTGRVAEVTAEISQVTDEISGSSSREDLETMLQLVYLNLTAPRVDKEAFEAYKEKKLNMIATMQSNPMASVSDSIMSILYPGDRLYQSLSADEVKSVDYERVMQLYRSRMTNAKDFKFFLVGNIDADVLRPLVERYIASLPVSKKLNTKAQDSRVPRYASDEQTKIYRKPMATPMSLVVNVFSGKLDYIQSNMLKLRIASEVLTQIYTKTLREEEGGTYGAQVSGNISRVPDGQAGLQVVYQTDPAKVEHLNEIVLKELNKVISDGVESEYFDKVISNLHKSHKVRLEENNYWLSQLAVCYTHGQDYVTNYEKILDSITREDVRLLLSQLIGQKNKALMVLKPE